VLVLALVLSAFAVGLDNFAAAIGIGLAGVDARTRLRVAIVFGLFEAGMPLAGLLIGHGAAQSLGRTTRYVGGAMLVAAGLWLVIEARTSRHPAADRTAPVGTGTRGTARLVLTALGLSVDNLIVGIGLGVTKPPLALALVVFAVVSVALTLAGLEVGRRLGARLQGPSDELAALVLIAVGILVATNVL
jgi:manganese efflux pump family protein